MCKPTENITKGGWPCIYIYIYIHAYILACIHTYIHTYTGSGRKTRRFLSYNKMKSILSFNVNLLLKLSLSQRILITYSLPEYSVCEVASLVVSTFPQAKDSDKNLKQSFEVLRSSK